jgi:hypothetical protein
MLPPATRRIGIGRTAPPYVARPGNRSRTSDNCHEVNTSRFAVNSVCENFSRLSENPVGSGRKMASVGGGQ